MSLILEAAEIHGIEAFWPDLSQYFVELEREINRQFNDRMKKFCQEKGYSYIDVHSRVSDEGGFIRQEWLPMRYTERTRSSQSFPSL